MTVESVNVNEMKILKVLKVLMLQTRIDTVLRYYVEIDILETGKN